MKNTSSKTKKLFSKKNIFAPVIATAVITSIICLPLAALGAGPTANPPVNVVDAVFNSVKGGNLTLMNITGVYGASSNQYGVYGTADTGHGVVGNSTSGWGVHGQSDSGQGVHGISDTGYGIEGTSKSLAGGYFWNGDSENRVYLGGNDYALSANAKNGNAGRFTITDTDPNNAQSAIYAEAKKGIGVEGKADAVGVKGKGDAIGVSGESTAEVGVGVMGATTGKRAAGVMGKADGEDGTGVRGESPISGGIGVWGDTSTGNGVVGNSSSSGTGVKAQSNSGTALSALSQTGYGIEGYSKSSTAGYFWNYDSQNSVYLGANDYALSAKAKNGNGVIVTVETETAKGGDFSNTVSNTKVELATSDNAIKATADGGKVIVAETDTGNAIYALAKGTGAWGVRGQATVGTGILGQTESGVGVAASSTTGNSVNAMSTSGTGLYASSVSGTAIDAISISGPAIKANGDVNINGKLTGANMPNLKLVRYSYDAGELFPNDYICVQDQVAQVVQLSINCSNTSANTGTESKNHTHTYADNTTMTDTNDTLVYIDNKVSTTLRMNLQPNGDHTHGEVQTLSGGNHRHSIISQSITGTTSQSSQSHTHTYQATVCVPGTASVTSVIYSTEGDNFICLGKSL